MNLPQPTTRRLMSRKVHLLAVASLIFLILAYSFGLGRLHLFDWDEINFAECTREMRISGEYRYAQIGFLPFWEKPPLFFWVQALSMSLWGETERGARFPNVVVAGITLWLLYVLGRKWHSPLLGWVWMIFQGIALLPAFYARSGLIDPLFNLFMLLAVVAGSNGLNPQGRAWRAGLWAGLWMSLATLTKGPVGLGLPGLALLSAGLGRRQLKALFVTGLIAALVVAAILGIWLGLLHLSGKLHLVQDFWEYQWRLFSTADSGHAGPWYYHIGVWLVGLLPASVWAIVGLRRLRFWTLPYPAQEMLWLALWTLVIFSLVRTKIIHYSSAGYFGITYLAALGWQKNRLTSLPWALSIVALVVLMSFSVLIPPFMKQVEGWLPWISDPFAQEVLRAKPVVWSGWEGWPALLCLGGAGLLFLLRLSSVARLAGLGLVTAGWEGIVLWTYAPRIEAYTQAPLIAFCERAAAEGAVVWPLGFKSYAPYFYGRMKPDLSPGRWGSPGAFEEALLRGEAGPVYFVSRVDRYKGLMETLNLQVVEQAGGYVLLLPRGVPPEVRWSKPPHESKR